MTDLRLHLAPSNTMLLNKNRPLGIDMVTALTEAQALAQTAAKALVESVLPSGLAP